MHFAMAPPRGQNNEKYGLVSQILKESILQLNLPREPQTNPKGLRKRQRGRLLNPGMATGTLAAESLAESNGSIFLA